MRILLSNLVFYGRVLLPYSYQCLTTKTSAQENRGYNIEILSISYISYFHIRLIVIL